MNLKKNMLLLTLAAVVLVTGCQKENSSPEGQFDRAVGATTPDSRDVPEDSATIPNVISSNLTLTSDKLWKLSGPTFVTNGATLTIEPGTFIKGVRRFNVPSRYPSFLLITRGSRLVANGTPQLPIVFTSEGGPGHRFPGDWGGIALLGNAHTNCGVLLLEAIDPGYVTSLGLPYPSTIQFGGGASYSGNSGSLQYVRIEFAGDVLTEGNELNSLTLAGVGFDTYLRNIQVSYGADDGFEFFGGAANAKNLIAYRNNDDDFDFDLGYQGTIQFAVSVKNPQFGYSSNPNGIESNNVTAPNVYTDTSKTRPVLTNFTVLGTNTTTGNPPGGIGALFRAGSGYVLANSLIGGFDTGGSFAGAGPGLWTQAAVHAFVTPGFGNPTSTLAATNNFLRLVNPFANYPSGTPDFRYITSTGGTSFTGLTVKHPGGAVTAIETTSYRGAFNSYASVANRWDLTFGSYGPLTNPYD